MKLAYLLLLLPGVVACNRVPADHFILCGTVPGAMDSTEVKLRFDGPGAEPVKGYVVGGRFELIGSVPEPMAATLSMNNAGIIERRGLKGKGIVQYREAHFFVENGNLTFTVPHIDSLPHSFWEYDIRCEENYTLKGSASHDVFRRFRRQTMDLQAEIRRLEKEYMEHGRPDDRQALQLREDELTRQIWAYIASQRNLAVNLYLARELERDPFTYDQAYLDQVTALFAGYADTIAALRSFRETWADAADYVQGKNFDGGKVCTPAGDTLDLKALISPHRYLLIDFWASWCTPCRASFPHLRKMFDAYGSGVEFISVSLDKKDKDWRKAMDEEKLRWPQCCATPALRKALGPLYAIRGIPTFLLVGPNGKIVFSGHSGDELERQLGQLGL